MSDGKFVMCIPVSKGAEVVYGVTKGSCSECKTAVWMAPSSTQLIATDAEVTVICTDCLPAIIARVDEEVAFTTAPGAIEEFRAYQKKVGNN